MTEHFDLAVAWDWEYDREFIQLLESQMHAHDLLFYSVTHHNVQETLKKFHDSDENFVPLSKKIRKASTFFVNLSKHCTMQMTRQRCT